MLAGGKKGNEINCVMAGQMTDEIAIANRCALVGWIGQLWCEKQYIHGMG